MPAGGPAGPITPGEPDSYGASVDDPRRAVFSPRIHAAQCVAGLALVAAGMAAIAFVGRDWSWPLFIWGLLMGPVMIGWLFLLSDTAARGLARAAAQPVDLRALRSTRVHRYWSTYVALCCWGFTMGVVAARLDSVWPDALLIGYAVLGSLPMVVAYPALKRRAAAKKIG